MRKPSFDKWIASASIIATCSGYAIASYLPSYSALDMRVFIYAAYLSVGCLAVISLIRHLKRNAALKFGPIYFIVPLIVFWISYSLRYYSDAVLHPEILNVAPDRLGLEIFCSSLPCLLLGMSLSGRDLKKLTPTAVMVSLVLLCILALRDREYVTVSRLRNESLGAIMLGHLGAAAVLLALFSFLSASDFLRSRNLFQLGVAILAFPLGFVVLLYAGSRGPVLAFVVCALMIGVYAIQKRAWAMIAVLGVVGILGGSFAYRYAARSEADLERISGIENYISFRQSSDRDVILMNAWNEFLNSPLTGSGMEESISGSYPHNIIIEGFMTTGIIGGSCLLWLCLLCLFQAGKAIVRGRAESWICILFIQAFVRLLFSNTIASDGFFWFSLGCVATLCLAKDPQVPSAQLHSLACK
jgi:hypothetical protein